MRNFLEIFMLAALTLLFLTILGVINTITGIIFTAIFALVALYGLIQIDRRKPTGTPTAETANIFESQVKFFDLVFKAITVLLVLAAILVYKDREDMRRRIDRDYGEMVRRADSLIDSLAICASTELNQSLANARLMIDSLKQATDESQKVSKKMMSIKEEARLELTRLKRIREEEANILYTKKMQIKSGFWGAEFRFCEIDSTDLQPNDAFYNNLGIYYFQQYSEDIAIEHFRRALQLNATSKNALYNLAVAHWGKWNKEDWIESAKCMDEYIKRYPNDIEGYVLKAHALIMVQETEKDALAPLREAIERGFKDYNFIITDFCTKDTLFLQLLPKEVQGVRYRG